MKIKTFIVIVLAQQLILTKANQNFFTPKLQQNKNYTELSRNLERSLYGLNSTKEISLGDISHKINEIIKDRNLNLISKSNSGKTNHFLIETPKGNEMNLNINKNEKGFKLNLNQRELSLDRSLQIGVQDYDLNQVGHFLHAQLQNIKSAERKLVGDKPDDYEYADWKTIIGESFPEGSGIQFRESEAVEGPLADKPYEFELVTDEDHELFSVKVSMETVKNRERKILKLANNEKLNYKDNHSKYERRIVEADTKTEIEDYLKETMQTIMEAIGKNQVVNMSEIITTIEAKKIKDLSLDVKEANKVYDLEYKKEYIGYMNLYEIGEKYFGVSIKLEDRSFSTKLPKSSHNFQKGIEQFLKEFENFLTGADNGGSPLVTIEFKEAVDKILDQMRGSCGNLDKDIKYDSAQNLGLKEASLKEHVAKFVLEDIDDCVFSKNEILIEQISTGYFQYIHLVVDANIMKTEYMIGLNKTSYDERAQKVIQEIQKKVETIKKSQEEADDDVDLKIDDVQKVIKETSKDSGVNCNKLDKEQFFTCEYDDTKSLFAVVKQTNSQILVNLMDNFKDSDDVKTSASNPSFTFQKRNGYDQMTGFKEDLTSFLEEQKSRRLKKELL